VECGEAHIGDFFIAKCDLMAETHRRRLRRIRSRHGRRGCTAHHRKRQTGSTQHRNGSRHVLFLRRLFYTLHSRNLHTCNWSDSSDSNLARDKSPRKAIAYFALNSPLLTGIWFILMNKIFSFVHRLFISIGGLRCVAEFLFSLVIFIASRICGTNYRIAFAPSATDNLRTRLA
jgi:hypothetical protein